MGRGQQFSDIDYISSGANQTSHDFEYTRGNVDFIIAASALRNGSSFTFTSTFNPDGFINPNNRRLYMFINITANPSAITLTPQINMIDPVTNASSVIEVAGSGATVTFISLFEFVPRTFKIIVDHSGAGDVTYSVGASLIIG